MFHLHYCTKASRKQKLKPTSNQYGFRTSIDIILYTGVYLCLSAGRYRLYVMHAIAIRKLFMGAVRRSKIFGGGRRSFFFISDGGLNRLRRVSAATENGANNCFLRRQRRTFSTSTAGEK